MMEQLAVSLETAADTKLDGRSRNGIRVKELRQIALSEQTRQKLIQDPYLEIWEIDYYSSSDEEDNDSERESEESSEEDSEVDSEEQKTEGNEEQKAATQPDAEE